MSQRKTTYKVPSDEVQGEGSYVELKYLTWGENRAAMKGEYKSDAILTDHLIGWNWVDAEGEPLELSVDVLFEPERKFILDSLFNPNAGDPKN